MSEKVPWIVTIILAMLGWIVAHAVERVNGAPTMEYAIGIDGTDNNKIAHVALANVTPDKVFDNIEIRLTGRADWEFEPTSIIPFQPAQGDQQTCDIDGGSMSCKIPRMMPGSEYDLSAAFTGRGNPSVEIRSVDGGAVFRLKKRGIETYLVRNELQIMVALLVIGVVVLLMIPVVRATLLSGRASMIEVAVGPRQRVVSDQPDRFG